MGRFPVLDADTDLFDKDATIRTVADHYSAAVDVSGFMTSDEVCSLGVAIHFPGITSGGAATITLTVCTGSTTTPTDVILTSQTFTLAECVTFFGAVDGFILPLPNVLLQEYVRINLAVGAAVLTAGVCTAGLVPMPT